MPPAHPTPASGAANAGANPRLGLAGRGRRRRRRCRASLVEGDGEHVGVCHHPGEEPFQFVSKAVSMGRRCDDCADPELSVARVWCGLVAKSFWLDRGGRRGWAVEGRASAIVCGSGGKRGRFQLRKSDREADPALGESAAVAELDDTGSFGLLRQAPELDRLSRGFDGVGDPASGDALVAERAKALDERAVLGPNVRHRGRQVGCWSELGSGGDRCILVGEGLRQGSRGGNDSWRWAGWRREWCGREGPGRRR